MRHVAGVIKQALVTARQRGEGAFADAALLTRYVTAGDPEAFALLVGRYGPMVWGVCRRLLRCPHDAADAFQATFLVLARRAGVIVPRERVGAWLFGVARQTALRARAGVVRRGRRECSLDRGDELPARPSIEG